jgi:hypothetical protein
MRLIPRHRHHRRPKGPLIAISEAEISADLHYPASARRLRRTADVQRLEMSSRRTRLGRAVHTILPAGVATRMIKGEA